MISCRSLIRPASEAPQSLGPQDAADARNLVIPRNADAQIAQGEAAADATSYAKSRAGGRAASWRGSERHVGRVVSSGYDSSVGRAGVGGRCPGCRRHPRAVSRMGAIRAVSRTAHWRPGAIERSTAAAGLTAGGDLEWPISPRPVT